MIARLLAGRDLDSLHLGKREGRVDLRGLPAPTPRRLDRFESMGWFVEELGDLVSFRGVRLRAIDFSGAQLPSLRFHDVVIDDCRFDGAACRDWRLWSSQVAGCSFSKADLRGSAIGTWHEGRRNEWRQVNFSGADFRVGVSEQALYEDCDFAGAKITGVQFSQCAFDRCRFAGLMSSVLFDGRDLPDRPAPPQMCKVDFLAAVFQEVEFRGFDLEDVRLPNDPDVRLYRRGRCVAMRGIQLLDGDESKLARGLKAVLANRLRGPGDKREADVFNRRDYMAWGGEDLARLAESIMDRAEADCVR
ncbi:MAG TPA: pentapeptide repeat-containing protein [Streptosporangiaceae bacterium]|nr:pentapeptide repeat-containing protein [Streptosporangiaceae bacterium]